MLKIFKFSDYHILVIWLLGLKKDNKLHRSKMINLSSSELHLAKLYIYVTSEKYVPNFKNSWYYPLICGC